MSGPSPAPKIGHRQGATERPTRVRDATKQWMLLILLVVTLAFVVALALWQMAKARREAPSRPDRSHPAPVSRTPPREEIARSPRRPRGGQEWPPRLRLPVEERR